MIEGNISKYQILRLLGRGGMGEVYLAHDPSLDRKVALKFLNRDAEVDQYYRARFMAEARVAAAVDHPFICKIYETSEIGSVPYIAMEYVDGTTMQHRIESQPIPLTEALAITSEIAEALVAAHAHGIVHGDLKPANLMFTAAGHIKLMDFGLARKLQKTSDLETTKPGSENPGIVGTLAYMSPELWNGEDPTVSSDLFALGIVLYQFLTGVHPFLRATREATCAAVLYEDVGESFANYAIPERVSSVTGKLLAKKVADRYDSAAEVLADLKNILAGNSAAVAASRSNAIAVLPFSDLSPARDQEYFCYGLAEDLITALASVNGLRVASKTSSFHFVGSELEATEVGRRLKVGGIVDGSVRKVTDRVRITIYLTDVNTGYQLWSERFDRQMSDIFELQDEIAAAIVKRFSLTDAATAPRRSTINIAAYETYLKGRYHWNKRTEVSLRASIECYKQAIALDRTYAAAWAGLADSYLTLGLYGAAPPSDTMLLARSAAEEALKLDSSLPEARTSLACIHCISDWNWSAGELEFRQVTQTNPRHHNGYQWFGANCLLPLARFEEAHSVLQRAKEIDPASLVTAATIGVLFYFQRRYDEAVEQQLQILRTEPGFGLSWYFLGQAYLEKGSVPEAISALERAAELTGRSSESLAALGCALIRSGDTALARATRGELLKRADESYVSPVLLAILAVGFEEYDEAMGYLHYAASIRATDLIWIGVRPNFDPLRDRAEFRSLCRDIGISGVRLN